MQVPLDLSSYLDLKNSERILSLPLDFENLPVEIISKEYTRLNCSHSYRIHYLGARFVNTYALHKRFSLASGNGKDKSCFEEIEKYGKYEVEMGKIVQSNYEKMRDNFYYKSSIFYRAFEGMNPTLDLKNELRFDSCFEGGNLDCVIKVTPNEYDLFLRIDSNTRGHAFWFYFNICNGKKLGRYVFRICNVNKNNSLFEQGMRPFVFSKRKYEKTGRKWEQDGENVELVEKQLRYEVIYENIDELQLYTLSFEYEFTEENDEVYFCYSIPYTYSQLLKDIKIMPDILVKKEILGKSLSGVDIPVLHITNHFTLKPKKNIVIIGRTHPSEANGSHLLKGFMDFLCSSASEAVEMRNKINFIIVPMSNPDGVILGNSRCSASGKDLNREYLNSNQDLYPEVALIKKLTYKIHKELGVFMFFDFHGHSRKKNTFLYGPVYTLSDSEYYKSRVFTKMIEKINPNFRYHSSSFMLSEEKKKTARGIFFEQYKIPYVFTIETSIGLYYDSIKCITMEFKLSEWLKMGSDISVALSQFLTADKEYEEHVKERKRQRDEKKEKGSKKDKKNTEESEDDLKKENLMFKLIEEIEHAPASKAAEVDESSDDHDEGENLENFKLAEFNNLIVVSKQKNQPKGFKVEEENYQEVFFDMKKGENGGDETQIIKESAKKERQGSPSKIANLIRNTSTSPEKNTEWKRNFPKRTLSLYQKEAIQKTSEKFVPLSQEIFSKHHKKFNNFETRRQIISKQFFPIDKCEIVDFPKSSFGVKQEIKRGRIMIDEYLRDKKTEKEIINEKKVKSKSTSNSKNMISLPNEKLELSPHSKKLKYQDSMNNRALSQRKIGEKNHPFFKPITSNKAFESVIFSNFKGIEVDNMAMMIRTFNR